jgi:cystathionine beta-lyase/cystathionine gamma-synthase
VSDSLLSSLALILPVDRIAGGSRSQIERVTSTSSAASYFRVWVGIEDEADLIADLEEALASTP